MSSASSDPINNFETNAGSFRSAARASAGAPRPDMARKVMDVEDLLIWAFRDELPKDRGLGGSHGPARYVSPLARMVAIGVSVDNWNREPGFPSSMGPPHPDALIVEAEVERLAQHADQAIEGDPLDLAPDFAALGIDEAGAVRRALGMMPAIVARCAKLRRRPFWHATTHPGAMFSANGRPVVVRWEPHFATALSGAEIEMEALVPVQPRFKDDYPFGAYSPLRYEPDPQAMADERAEYLVWWGALQALATALTGKLATIAVLPPTAPQKPWIDDGELGRPPRLFDDLTARVYRQEQSGIAAAHRKLGLRRSHGARGPAARRGAPVRAVAPAKRACAVG